MERKHMIIVGAALIIAAFFAGLQIREWTHAEGRIVLETQGSGFFFEIEGYEYLRMMDYCEDHLGGYTWDKDCRLSLEKHELVDLRADQEAACYRGCQYATQPNLNVTNIDDQQQRIELYDACLAACRVQYEWRSSGGGSPGGSQ